MSREAPAPVAEAVTGVRSPLVTTVGQRAGGAPVPLIIAALGVVFGDIGTSPLYALQTVFALDGGIVEPTTADVFGVVSMVFWSITLIVSVKYLNFILRADNEGEGGVMALAHLAARSVRPGSRRHATVLVLGVFGGSLFFGDSLITPAISVLSAVEGLKVAAPGPSAGWCRSPRSSSSRCSRCSASAPTG